MLKHIKECNLIIGEKTYWATDDKDILIETVTISKELHLDKTKKRIIELKKIIDENKNKLDDKNCLDAYNTAGREFDETRNNIESNLIRSEIDKIWL